MGVNIFNDLKIQTCFVLAATQQQLQQSDLRFDVFGMIVDRHPPLMSILMSYVCQTLSEVGESAITLIEHLPCSKWKPTPADIQLINGKSKFN